MDIFSQIKRLLLYTGDIVLFYLTLILALLLRYPGRFDGYLFWEQHFWPFTALFGIWILAFYISGLYDTKSVKNDIHFYGLVIRTVSIGAGLGVVYFYVFSNRFFNIKPQVTFLVYLAAFSVLFLLWRRLYNAIAQNQAFKHNVLLVGQGKEMEDLAHFLRHKPYLGYRVAEHLSLANGNSPDLFGNDLKNLNLHPILLEKKIDTVVTTLELHRLPEIVSQFYQNLFMGISYFDFPTFYERVTGKVPVTTIGQLWFLENLSENEKKFYEIFKRAAEIFLTLALGIVGLALSPFVALAIKFDSPGPIFFTQSRSGKSGKVFRAMKFRTMKVGAEKNGPQWARQDDPRITRVGKFLRQSRLDEIPQLLNILKGEMSFIGPRPERPEFVAELTRALPFYNERHLIKPGLTGWAQVNFKYGASAEAALEKLQYDLYYIKNRSLLLDLGILLKTVNIVLSGKGQ